MACFAAPWAGLWGRLSAFFKHSIRFVEAFKVCILCLYSEALDIELIHHQALNIPTFINLYGYGFKNLYELSETVKVTDKRLEYRGVK